MSPEEVYTEAAKAFIRSYGNLDTIREGGIWGPAETPSRVPDWQMRGRVSLARIENALWGPALPNASEYTLYKASGDIACDFQFGDDRRLVCSGLILDSKSSLTARGRG